jgi:hypothetical protein
MPAMIAAEPRVSVVNRIVVVFAGLGALLGVTMLLIGVPVVWLARPRTSMEGP